VTSTMSKPVTIVEAKADDMAAVAAIYAPYVRETLISFEETPPDAEQMRSRWQKVLESGLPFIVAVDVSGKVLGYAYASTFRDRFGYRFVAENSLYVDKDARFRGIGKALLSELIGRCRTGGPKRAQIRTLIATISDPASNAASVNLHKRFGFVQRGHFVGIGDKLSSRAVDVDMFQLDIAPPAGESKQQVAPAVSAGAAASVAAPGARLDIAAMLKAQLAGTGAQVHVHGEPAKRA